MTYTIQQFKFEQQYDIRTITLKGETWFVVQDLCKALGYIEPIESHDIEGLSHYLEREYVINTGQLWHVLKFTNKSGLYSLIMISGKPVAKRFKQWINSEVLVSARQIADDNDTLQTNTEELEQLKSLYSSVACFCL
ncbi:Bro-N domain-containing protein [Aetokthonos hydrillicola Thurmond2011]|jgi:prophage antirepressor-like protein|uniref:Bro-N domain-containing protein n=1 Tax=Aetokthonos hydrillicola Thurmond2011 TaxID=2712845 RepID=A0AAP5IDG1_9CYAN|nr:Bro-N domain-containing protein [Aetokthonos hydrillicola]MBO3458380.1 Bro-N domain-containing protein [Aetokthonos hydrillicola CCALA 1050]MBW4586080.1 Bro-N domain-containing protein [Aetokthonos hydrillicola CCALA 1050]MDR9897688.1 Bro-N domain-containing protein [Aetokthonos hydrillicola Thurmond2011]